MMPQGIPAPGFLADTAADGSKALKLISVPSAEGGARLCLISRCSTIV